jgi:hypothetical protein
MVSFMASFHGDLVGLHGAKVILYGTAARSGA